MPEEMGRQCLKDKGQNQMLEKLMLYVFYPCKIYSPNIFLHVFQFPCNVCKCVFISHFNIKVVECFPHTIASFFDKRYELIFCGKYDLSDIFLHNR